MPVGKMAKVGVWEDGRFVGVVLFSQGNNQFQGNALGLTMREICELTRVALTTHKSSVSRMVAIALRMLKMAQPGLRIVLSYADPEHGHVGGIYQAGGWVYVGTGGSREAFYEPSGRRVHSRRVSPTGLKSIFGKAARVPARLTRVSVLPKHKYLMPLDAEMRERIAPLVKPYPRALRLESEAPGVQSGDEGAAMRPTRSNLQVAHG
jgi:hypothetical protein